MTDLLLELLAGQNRIEGMLQKLLAGPVAAQKPLPATAIPLIHALFEEIGDDGFFTAQVFRLSKLRSRTRLAAALQAAGTTNPHLLGRFLAKIRGHNLNGLVVAKITKEHGATVWTINICK